MCSNYGIVSASSNHVTNDVTVGRLEARLAIGRFGCAGVGTVRA